MNIREFKECVEFNIRYGIRHAILGLGAPGVGKSQVVKQIGEKYGYKVIDLRLAQMSEVEIGGLIYPNEDHTKTRWLSPEILPDEERDGPKTILLLDEITSCPKRVQVAAYQLILDRRVGQYTLPLGTFVVGLGNREDDDGVYIRLAGPLADRFEIHNIDVDCNVWREDFALPYGIHPYVVSYLSMKPSALHTQGTEPENMVFATPRSWERVSDLLKYDCSVSNPVLVHKIAGNIGETEAAQFVRYIEKNRKLVDASDFLDGKAEVPKDPSEAVLLVHALTGKVGFIKNAASSKDMSRHERKLVEKVVSAMFRLGNAEYTVIGLKELLSLNRGLVKRIFLENDDPGVERFISDNEYLLEL